MRLTELEQLKTGMVVYKAYALERSSFVKGPIKIIGDPFKTDVGMAIPCDAAGYQSYFFPSDANIGGHYNKHRLYTTVAEAQGYVDYVKRVSTNSLKTS